MSTTYATIDARNLTSYDETISTPDEIQIHDDGRAVAVHTELGDFEYDSLGELLRHYEITAESWQAAAPVEVRIVLAAEDSAKTYVGEFGREPEDEWPIVASGAGNSYGSTDYSRYQQALAQGELDRYSLRARRHADGRAIVYAVLDAATAWTGNEDVRGAELLPAGSDLAAALRRVGEFCHLPDSVIREAIADLPAEEI